MALPAWTLFLEVFLAATIVALHHLSISIFWVCAAAMAFAACVLSLPLAFATEVRCGVFIGEEGSSAVALALALPTASAFCKAAYAAAEPSHRFPSETAPDTFSVAVLVEDVFSSVGFAHVADIRHDNVLSAIV